MVPRSLAGGMGTMAVGTGTAGAVEAPILAAGLEALLVFGAGEDQSGEVGR